MTKRKWTIDPAHSEIGFKVKHLMMTSISGNFTKFEELIETIEEDFMQAKITFKIHSNSVTTGNEQRDGHLKGPDFFNSEKYPFITFTATKYENVDQDGSYELYGDLTIKEITKQIKLDVEFGGLQKDPYGNVKGGFTINGKINRKDWELNWNAALESGGVLVSEEVRISCEVQIVKQS